MRRILAEIQSGQFAKEWLLENQVGRPVFNAIARNQADHPIEQVGRRLRGMMSWINTEFDCPSAAPAGRSSREPWRARPCSPWR